MVVIYEIPILGELAPIGLTLDRLLHSGRSFFIAGVWPTTQAGVIHGYMEEMEALYEPDEKSCVGCFGNGVAVCKGHKRFYCFLCGCYAHRIGRRRRTGQYHYVFSMSGRFRCNVWFYRDTGCSIPDQLKERTGKK